MHYFCEKKLYKVENSFKEKASNMHFSLRQLLHFLGSLESYDSFSNFAKHVCFSNKELREHVLYTE